MLPAEVDGLDQWESLQKNSAAVRMEMLYNINPARSQNMPLGAAIRYGLLNILVVLYVDV